MEIKIGQEGIKELVKQTKASIQQANDAREEVEITNKTMKHQQFDNTFFNMVKLHHTILENLKVDTTKSDRDFNRHINAEGRELISILYDDFIYLAQEEYRSFKFNKYFSDEEIEEVFDNVYPIYEKDKLIEELYDMVRKGYILHNSHDYLTLKKKINNGSEYFKGYPKLRKIIEQHPNISNQIDGTNGNLRDVLLKLPYDYRSKHYHERMSDDFEFIDECEWETAKRDCYETFYKNMEYIFGHYYRNLYRIVKYINESEMIDCSTKKEYRGILRAQLSSHELMMLFYNVVYSEKGRKFKDQIQDKNFFDDHLILDGLAWNDDLIQLKKIK